MTSLRLVFVFLVLTATALAQNAIDLLALSARYGMPASYNQTPTDYSGPSLDDKKATESGLFFNAKAPLKFSEKTIWFTNLSYTNSVVKNGVDLPETMQNPINLHGFVLQTGLVQKLDDKRAIQLLYVPRYMTDELTNGVQAWQHGAIGLFEYRWNSTFMMRFGAMYNQGKSGPLLTPLFDVNWQISEKWSMFGLFPIYLKVNYQAHKRLAVGLSHFGLLTTYQLHNPNYDGDYMERTSIDLCSFARWQVYGNWHLEGRLGYAVGRTYAQYHADEKIDFRLSIFSFGDHRDEPVNATFTNGPIAELRLVYALPLPQ